MLIYVLLLKALVFRAPRKQCNSKHLELKNKNCPCKYLIAISLPWAVVKPGSIKSTLNVFVIRACCCEYIQLYLAIGFWS